MEDAGHKREPARESLQERVNASAKKKAQSRSPSVEYVSPEPKVNRRASGKHAAQFSDVGSIIRCGSFC